MRGELDGQGDGSHTITTLLLYMADGEMGLRGLVRFQRAIHVDVKTEFVSFPEGVDKGNQLSRMISTEVEFGLELSAVLQYFMAHLSHNKITLYRLDMVYVPF